MIQRSIMKHSRYYLFGLLAPVVFILTAILGGVLRPGYSHAADTVSELFAPGSPNRLLLSAFYLLFSVCLIFFGVGLRHFVQSIGKKIQLGSWASFLFILVGVLNILTATVFPQDPWGTEPTFPGKMHQYLSAIITFLSFGYMILFGMWFLMTGLKKNFCIYSLATVAGAVGAGVWFTASVGTPVMGIAERVVILIGLQYTLVLSILLIRSEVKSPSVPG